jgi:hypothetical protein
LPQVVGEVHRHDREAVLLAEPTAHHEQPLVVGDEPSRSSARCVSTWKRSASWRVAQPAAIAFHASANPTTYRPGNERPNALHLLGEIARDVEPKALRRSREFDLPVTSLRHQPQLERDPGSRLRFFEA